MSDSLLRTDDLTKQFGSLVAVNDVSLSLEAGDPIALIGPNGAGKTTLYDILSGLLQPTSGTIRFKGEDVTGASPYELTQLGVGRSFQITNIFEGLTVRQNIRAPVIARSTNRLNLFRNVNDVETVQRTTDEVLELLELDDIADETCDTLPYGDKRRIEIGITLATDPDIVFLDEPTAGLTPTETQEMTDFVNRLSESTDITFLITEHDIDVIFSLASRVLVLAKGEIIADGSPKQIQEDSRVRSAYLGEEVEA